MSLNRPIGSRCLRDSTSCSCPPTLCRRVRPVEKLKLKLAVRIRREVSPVRKTPPSSRRNHVRCKSCSSSSIRLKPANLCNATLPRKPRRRQPLPPNRPRASRRNKTARRDNFSTHVESNNTPKRNLIVAHCCLCAASPSRFCWPACRDRQNSSCQTCDWCDNSCRLLNAFPLAPPCERLRKGLHGHIPTALRLQVGVGHGRSDPHVSGMHCGAYAATRLLRETARPAFRPNACTSSGVSSTLT